VIESQRDEIFIANKTSTSSKSGRDDTATQKCSDKTRRYTAPMGLGVLGGWFFL
jgi:hypothetical protein